MNPPVEKILAKAKEAYDRLNIEERAGTVWALLLDEERNTVLVLCEPPPDDHVEADLRQNFAEGAYFVALELIPFGTPEFITFGELSVDDAAIIASQLKFPRYMTDRNKL